MSARYHFSAVLAAILLLAGSGSAETIVQEEIPVDGLVLPHPCTLEPLAFEGRIHVTARVNLDGSGGANVGLHVNTQGVSAQGQVSGARYQSADIVNQNIHVGPLPATSTAVVQVHFAGPGEDRFRAHVVLHVTITESGNALITLGDPRLECR